MAWFALARVLFVVAVAYAAAFLQPLPVGVPANVGFALVLAALVVAFERGLRETAVTRIFGALIGAPSASRWRAASAPGSSGPTPATGASSSSIASC
jgi:hypothetical protein